MTDEAEMTEEERVEAVATAVAAENEAAPSSEEVAEFYAAPPAPDIAPEPQGIPLEVFAARVQHAAGDLSDEQLAHVTADALGRAEEDLREALEKNAADAASSAPDEAAEES